MLHLKYHLCQTVSDLCFALGLWFYRIQKLHPLFQTFKYAYILGRIIFQRQNKYYCNFQILGRLKMWNISTISIRFYHQSYPISHILNRDLTRSWNPNNPVCFSKIFQTSLRCTLLHSKNWLKISTFYPLKRTFFCSCYVWCCQF